MEKKTNKGKLEFSNFEKIGRIARLAFDKIRRNCAFYWKFNKYTLTRAFLHVEFISAMKTVQNPTVFMKRQK